MKALLASLFIFSLHSAVHAEYSELCRLFKDGTQLRKPGTCNEYIKCFNGTGTVQPCDETKLYDRSREKCSDIVTLSNDDYCSNPCDGINGKWVANSANCQGFFYCVDGRAYPGFCDQGYHFSVKEQMCVFDTNSGCRIVTNICEIAPDNAVYRDESDCVYYYQCKNGKASRTACKNKTYFNVKTGKCEEKSLVECTAVPVPSNTCGGVKPKPGFKSDGATCRGYFYCRDMGTVKDLEPIWGQCSEGQFFDVDSGSCKDPLDVYCPYNRCQGRGNMLVQSSTNNCRDYIACVDGVAMKEVTCRQDMFFDEKLQSCVRNIISYGSCDGT